KKLHGMGPTGVNKLRDALHRRGLSFTEEKKRKEKKMEAANSKSNMQPVAERNLDGYGAPVIPWEKVLTSLEQGIEQQPGGGGPDRHTFWLATINEDGTPHVVPVGALWENGIFYFTAGQATRKARNLAHNPNCIFTVATHDFDLAFEGKGE